MLTLKTKGISQTSIQIIQIGPFIIQRIFRHLLAGQIQTPIFVAIDTRKLLLLKTNS